MAPGDGDLLNRCCEQPFRIKRMARQLRLGFRDPAAQARDGFVPGGSNAQARSAIDAWPSWPSNRLALVGPEGVGKSHLAQIWAAEAGALVLDRRAPDLAVAATRPVVVEDVDLGIEAEALFHLINIAERPGCGLLLTARTPPLAWPAALPDLRSRLNALMVAEIAEPDDEVLTGVLKKFFRELYITPQDEVYPYLVKRMERTIPGAWDIVERLHEPEGVAPQPVSRALARQILEGVNQNLDLFE
jgi:chromosomal replication initiation ATPase DnaA